MKFNNPPNVIRKWSRIIHRDLSFFFTGAILIYAISGIIMNHRDSINPHYSVALNSFVLVKKLPPQNEISKEDVIEILTNLDEADSYTKHYFPEKNILKVFIKGGSSLVVDIDTHTATFEKLTKRPILSFITKLHYNPGRWWTLFADLFAFSLLIITLSGLIMLKGRKGLSGRGGVELIAGMLVPLLFLLI